MSVLIALLFPPIAMLYTMVVHKKDFSIASYISGVISGLCVIPFCLMLKLTFYTSSNFFLYSFSFFFSYFLLPSIFGLFVYYMFNFRSFEVRTSAVALAGIWSVFLFFSVYEFISTPTNAIYFILILSYIASVFFFDFLIAIFSSFSSLYLFVTSYVLLLIFSFVACLSFGCWVFKYSPLVYVGLLTMFIFILFFSIFILENSNRRVTVSSLLD